MYVFAGTSVAGDTDDDGNLDTVADGMPSSPFRGSAVELVQTTDRIPFVCASFSS